MTGLERNIFAKATYLLEEFPVIAILGTRQCGKTTLSKQLRPNWQYIDLENPRDFDRISYDPLLFFQQFNDHVIIDEAQIYPELFKVLRGVIDKDRQKKGRFILTGSSSPYLKENIAESLAGRIAYIELSPFKINEFYESALSDFYDLFAGKLNIDELVNIKAKLTLEQVRNVWLYGGYPEPLIRNNKKFWTHWMEQYIDAYIYRDISLLFPKLNKVNYRRFLRILAALSGTIINKADLARDIEVSQPTIHEYLTIAEGTFLWRNLPSYEKSKAKTIVKMPKGYIRDSGLLHFLRRIHDFETLMSDPIMGLSFESFIIEELIRGIAAKDIVSCDYYYYRTKNKAEIDMIIECPGGIIPIEIKCSSYTPMKQLQSLKNFIEENNLKYGLVINQAENIEKLSNNIIQIPANYL